MPRHSKIKGQLINVTTGQRMTLNTKGRLIKPQKLVSGRYQIKLENTTKQVQFLWIQRTRNFVLAPQPLVINGRTYDHRSLIYQFIDF
ncbi:hypothetical protein C5Z25_07050 [Lactobacillus sp. CBA3605]|nr:hypothetical protein C5Z25_07050 [Lactobacillus sp. CBA3605]